MSSHPLIDDPLPTGRARHRRFVEALHLRPWTILLCLLASAGVGFLAARLLPERYQSGFSLRAQGSDPAAEVERLARLEDGVDASTAGDGEAGLIEVECVAPTARAARDRCDDVLRRTLEAWIHPPGAEPAVSRGMPADGLADSLGREAAGIAARLTALRDSLASARRAERSPAIDRPPLSEAQRMEGLARREELIREADLLRDLVLDLEWGLAGRRAHLDSSHYPAELRGERVSALLNELTDLEKRREGLAASRSEKNPDLVAIDERIEAALEELRTVLTQRERSLREEIGALEALSTEGADGPAPSATPSIDLARLERQIARLEEQRSELAERSEVALQPTPPPTPSPIVVVSAPSPPRRISSPGSFLLPLAGSLAGLALGLALALRKKDRAEPPVETPERTLPSALPVLVALPKLLDPAPAFPAKPRVVMGLIPRHPPHTSEQWALRRALESLLAALGSASGKDNERVRTVGVTSATGGEGRTFVACNLALASAARGGRTLLVDADIGAEGLVHFFRLSPSKPGLLEILKGRAALEDVAVEFLVAESGRLDVVPPGNRYWGFEGALQSPAFRSVLRDVAGQYNLVVVDGPPAGGPGDGAAIASAVGAILFVVGPGHPGRGAIEAALGRLAGGGGHILGAVLNGGSTLDAPMLRGPGRR